MEGVTPLECAIHDLTGVRLSDVTPLEFVVCNRTGHQLEGVAPLECAIHNLKGVRLNGVAPLEYTVCVHLVATFSKLKRLSNIFGAAR